MAGVFSRSWDPAIVQLVALLPSYKYYYHIMTDMIPVTPAQFPNARQRIGSGS